ncbi:MAG: ABC transporter substrate-binding protein [Deinococcota bacterium]|jgi:iron complex transport system substrate-binding protein|nr:ABC transporter substrate-binding protein [Deinococcota bacterium]
MRLVSLACSNTEILWALGSLDGLVGVDDHSDFPAASLKNVPRVGPDLDIDLDKVAALEPDLVLATLTVPGHERVIAGLEKACLPFLAPEPVSLGDVYGSVREIAGALGVAARGEAVVADMRRQLAPASAAERPSLLVQWWPKPVIAPCRDSWVSGLLEAAGGVNPLGERPGKSVPLSDEEVAQLDPDAIVLAWCGVDPAKYRPDVVYRKPAWQGLKAVTRGQIFCVPEAYLGRPGPRLTEGYRALRTIVETVRAPRQPAS